jgi:hypothetical protein
VYVWVEVWEAGCKHVNAILNGTRTQPAYTWFELLNNERRWNLMGRMEYAGGVCVPFTSESKRVECVCRLRVG